MKNAVYMTFTVLIFLVLTGKVLNWFLNFSDDTNRILNMAMFTLIGVAYIVMGYIWDGRFLKIVIATCGVYLIAMNFFSKNIALEIIGIVCILSPMLIVRFYKGKESGMNVQHTKTN